MGSYDEEFMKDSERGEILINKGWSPHMEGEDKEWTHQQIIEFVIEKKHGWQVSKLNVLSLVGKEDGTSHGMKSSYGRGG